MSTLTLKKQQKVDAAIELSKMIGMRFIERKGRYTMQVELVEPNSEPQMTTWVDVPLCPETYGPAT